MCNDGSVLHVMRVNLRACVAAVIAGLVCSGSALLPADMLTASSFALMELQELHKVR